MAQITFIIPTIGRSSLIDTLNCLIKQTNPNWNAIVVFDGISPNIISPDNRICFLESEKLGQGVNSAGLVRNYGMAHVNTEWIGFIDDDDGISDDYVATIYNEILNYDNDVIIFRMLHYGRILPSLHTDHFYYGQVGISFIIKKKIFDDGHIFIPSGEEDFVYLDGTYKKSYKIMISPYVKYFVRTYETYNENLGNRLFIHKLEDNMTSYEPREVVIPNISIIKEVSEPVNEPKTVGLYQIPQYILENASPDVLQKLKDEADFINNQRGFTPMKN
jgi:glycosyltransferase involved in cell wall biosynthesis